MTATHSSDRAPAGEEAAIGYETSDVNVGGVFIFALGLFITVLVVHLALWMLFAFFAESATSHAVRQYPLAVGHQDRLPPYPRLQVNPREDLRELRSAEDAVLTSYGWVDKSNGFVRIPIDEAMKLTVQRGLPARGKP
jgi:hypothetical protein